VKPNFTIIAVYVHHLAIASNHMNPLKHANEMLKERFIISLRGTCLHILGLRVQPKRNNISIHQPHYVEPILEKFRILDCHPVATPIHTSLKLTPLADRHNTINNPIYRSAVASLMYPAVATCPHIAAAVGILARYVQKPAIAHCPAVKRIMRYLKLSTQLLPHVHTSLPL
jgi:Reverse transcriptase (RNA-dependent DNA polymerase)